MTWPSYLGFLALLAAFWGYFMYLRHQHKRALSGSRQRAMRGDRSITLKLTLWGILREVPSQESEDW